MMPAQPNHTARVDGDISIALLRPDIAQALPGLTDEFDRRWVAAHAELSALGSSPITKLSATCNPSKTFQTIESMGPKIVPLVVEKLARDTETTENLWAVLLYNILESDENYRSLPKDSQDDLSQCRARIVELNTQRNKLLDDRLEALKQKMVWARRLSNHDAITQEDEYVVVWEMGKSAITPVMLAYLSMPNYPWHWLLHEMAHDVQLNGYVFNSLVFLEKWKDFFNNREGGDLPAYAYTAEERSMYN